ncbi:MAG TPA: hypothetical protein VIG80_02020 [Bacillaceae bacterium]
MKKKWLGIAFTTALLLSMTSAAFASDNTINGCSHPLKHNCVYGGTEMK